MKIEGGRGVNGASQTRRAGASSAAPGFSPQTEAAQHAAPAQATSAVTALDAILALQADEPVAERRARQVRRGRQALDALDELVRGLVTGHAPGGLRGQLESLQRAAQPTGEAELDSLLREIDTRVAVELAKLDRLVAA